MCVVRPRGRTQRRAGRCAVRRRSGETGAGHERRRSIRYRRSHARRGNPGCRRARGHEQEWPRLPAGNAFEMGACRRRPRRALHLAHDRRSLRRAARHHHPRPHDERRRPERRLVSCRHRAVSRAPAACCIICSACAHRPCSASSPRPTARLIYRGFLSATNCAPNSAECKGETVHLIGAPELVALYARAISACGSKAVCHDGDASVLDLAIIGEHTQ